MNTYTCVESYTNICKYTRVFVYLYAHAYVYIYIHIMCLHIEKEGERKAARKKGQPERTKEIETDK